MDRTDTQAREDKRATVVFRFRVIEDQVENQDYLDKKVKKETEATKD